MTYALIVLPFVLNVPFAFSQWSSYSQNIPFVGFDNFVLLWNSGALGGAIWLTVVYAVIAMTVQNVVALSLALALQETNRINTFFRSIFFLPVFISPLAAGANVARFRPINAGSASSWTRKTSTASRRT